MLKYVPIATLILVLPVVSLVTAMRSPGQETTVQAPATVKQEKTPKKNVEKEEVPVVKFETEATGKQKQMSNAHDKSISEMPEITDITESESWIERLPALPMEKSDAVIVGTVAKAEAHLSTGQTSVYSEYAIVVDEVFSDKTNLSLVSGSTFTAVREGGGVQFASGHIQVYRMSGQGFLKPNRKYVLFVKRTGETHGFLLLTGYQLRRDRVIPVDQVSGHAVYAGANVGEFLTIVRTEISNYGSWRQACATYATPMARSRLQQRHVRLTPVAAPATKYTEDR